MQINIVLCIFWLVIGLGLFALQLAEAPIPWIYEPYLGLSPGWVALFLSLWNAVRALRRYVAQAAAENQRRIDVEWQREQAEHKALHPPQPPDPNFNFSQPPPRQSPGG